MNRKKFINGCMHEFMNDSLRKKSLSKALYPELSISQAKYICGCVYDDMKYSHNKTTKNLKKFVKQCALDYKPKRKSRRNPKRISKRKSRRNPKRRSRRMKKPKRRSKRRSKRKSRRNPKRRSKRR